MAPHMHVQLEGDVEVPLTQREAFELFTPSGERRWAHGWNPSFPASVLDETTPGTVFQTEREHVVNWIVAGCDRPHSITYAISSQDDRAGIIRVSCEARDDGTTTAHVVYDMTALSDVGDAALEAFATQYDQHMEHWQHAIAAAVSSQ